MGTGFAKRKKQAKQFQEQMMKMQEQMKEITATGTAGNGLVTITLNGDQDLIDLKIKPECVDPEDVEGLEDLIRVAYSEAAKDLKEKSSGAANMPSMPGMPDMGALGDLGL